MKVIDDLTGIALPQESILTIGAFDGLHRGHQILIGEVVRRAHATARLAALVTFHPHPAMVLAPHRAPRYLTTPGEKIALLENMGVDLVVLLPFSREIAETPARTFMQTLADSLQFKELFVGADFALGRDREGDVNRLREIGRELGFDVHSVQPLVLDGGIVSSSRIRALLRDGAVEEAARLLGRFPSISGEVVLGAHRGQALGFPTANLEVRPERAVPSDGVYAVYALLGDERLPAVANIGVRPSFNNGQRTVETHIFDFDRDIYGCDLVVEFVARLRGERRFEDIDDLVEQIRRDNEEALRILGSERADAESSLRSGPCRYRYLEVEHTADRALEVWGDELHDLFAGAARGMYSLMADLEDLVAMDWREIRLEAQDLESLLVDWLSELLFLTETEDLIFTESRIKVVTGQGPDSNGASMVARVGGVPAAVTRAHIKAATYHDLSVEQDETGWSTVVTFDV